MPAVADDPMADIVAGDAAAARPEPTELVGGLATEPAELTGADAQPLQNDQAAPQGWTDATGTPATTVPPMSPDFQQYLAHTPPNRDVHLSAGEEASRFGSRVGQTLMQPATGLTQLAAEWLEKLGNKWGVEGYSEAGQKLGEAAAWMRHVDEMKAAESQPSSDRAILGPLSSLAGHAALMSTGWYAGKAALSIVAGLASAGSGEEQALAQNPNDPDTAAKIALTKGAVAALTARLWAAPESPAVGAGMTGVAQSMGNAAVATGVQSAAGKAIDLGASGQSMNPLKNPAGYGPVISETVINAAFAGALHGVFNLFDNGKTGAAQVGAAQAASDSIPTGTAGMTVQQAAAAVGLAPDASLTPDTVDAAWRKSVWQAHPDQGGSPTEAGTRFAEIARARATLRDYLNPPEPAELTGQPQPPQQEPAELTGQTGQPGAPSELAPESQPQAVTPSNLTNTGNQSENEVVQTPTHFIGPETATAAEVSPPPPAEQLEAMVGPSAASVTDPAFTPPRETTDTATMNRVTDQERVAAGVPAAVQPDMKPWASEMASAHAEAASDPGVRENLIESLKTDPRAVTSRENFLLLDKQNELNQAYRQATDRLIAAHDSGDEAQIAEMSAKASALSDQRLELYDVIRSAGTETAQGLAARNAMMKEDYSLGAMESAKRAANRGEPLTPKQNAEVTGQAKQIEDIQTKIDAGSTAGSDAASTKAVEGMVAESTKNVKKPGTAVPRTVDFNARQAELLGGLKAKIDAQADPSDVASLIQRLAKNFLAKGVKEREPLIDAVHGAVKDIAPDMTRRQVMDAISGYGDFKPLSKDAVSVKLRDLKGQMQQVAKISDMVEKGTAPLKTGVERRVPSAEERSLIKEVGETKKRLNIQTTDPATQLKSALDAAKTRATNEIADIELQLKKGKRAAGRVPNPQTDAALSNLRDRLATMREVRDAVFGETSPNEQAQANRLNAEISKINAALAGVPEAAKVKVAPTDSPYIAGLKNRLGELRQEQFDSDAAKLKRAQAVLNSYKTRTQGRIDELQGKIDAGDFSQPARVSSLVPDAQATALKAQLERVKQQFQQGLNRDRMANRTGLEKTADTFVKWRRAFVLSWPTVFGKLTGASAARMTTAPLENVAKRGFSAAFPRLAEGSTRGPGFSTAIEAKAITDGFTKGMADGWKKLTTGKSDLDALYGKNNGIPQTALDYIINLHAALKAPAMRNEFSRSLQERLAQVMKRGGDPTDPAVQMKASVEAYQDARRAIFLQNNVAVSMFKRGMSALDEKSKVTGKTPAANKLAATAVRTAIPITTVPTNVIAETTEHIFGLATGIPKLAKAYATGVENLQPAERDVILRQLSKGAIGAAALMLGYFARSKIGGFFQSGKRKPTDVPFGSVHVFGHNVPPILLHNPMFLTLQVGASLGRAMDHLIAGGSSTAGSIAPALQAAALGLIKDVPFVRETIGAGQTLEQGLSGKAAGTIAGSIASPGLAQWEARREDVDAQGNPIPRKPGTFGQGFNTAIPGLRQTVPLDEKKIVGQAFQQGKQSGIDAERAAYQDQLAKINAAEKAGTISSQEAFRRRLTLIRSTSATLRAALNPRQPTTRLAPLP